MSGWQSPSFSDAAWASGAAPLGFGSSGLATNIDVPAGTTRPRSATFRQSFHVTGVPQLSDVSVTTRADDGVVVWVNGVEVGRSRMSAGTVSGSVNATSAVRTSVAMSAPVTFPVPTSLLREGANVVAVSTHLNYRTTPDASIALTMNATRTN